MNQGARKKKKIPVTEIKEGAILMKDGSLKGVLMIGSLNFSLKSSEEQEAITYRYQEFLNSLDFPIQILVSTRKFDVSDYLKTLEQKRVEQENELLKIQTSEYIDFVKNLSQMVNIMSTYFYVIVPFTQSIEKQATGLIEKMKKSFGKKNGETKLPTFQQMRAGLWQRMEYISSGLSACSLKTVALNDDELVELLYKMYNPGARERPVINV
ncbi:MAG: hypothetical protein HY764_04005 [Candidatus Portnoybacteria bacterium]|nr:hypothetical protein [Candidatus Portnoybacteria bacterium]